MKNVKSIQSLQVHQSMNHHQDTSLGFVPRHAKQKGLVVGLGLVGLTILLKATKMANDQHLKQHTSALLSLWDSGRFDGGRESFWLGLMVGSLIMVILGCGTLFIWVWKPVDRHRKQIKEVFEYAPYYSCIIRDVSGTRFTQ